VTPALPLVDGAGCFDGPQVAALRSAGNDISQCPGPLHQVRACPLVNPGRCQLAEQAGLIVSLLPRDEPGRAAVLAAQRGRWPHRLAQ
jgi:hypothetical protein